MDIKRLWDTLVRKAWIIVIMAVIGGVMAWFFVRLTYIPTYTTTCTLFVTNRDKMEMTGESLDASDISFSQQLIATYSSIIQSRLVATEAMQQLRGVPGLSENGLREVVSVSSQKGSNMLSISVSWTDPDMAALICNTVSEVFANKVNELTNSNSVGIVDKALIPGAPSPSNSMQKIVLGILMGLALGFGIIYCIVQLDTTVHAVGDIEHGLELKVIGIIPEHSIR